MKDLFEELKEALPVDKSMKTSKWEILSKGKSGSGGNDSFMWYGC